MVEEEPPGPLDRDRLLRRIREVFDNNGTWTRQITIPDPQQTAIPDSGHALLTPSSSNTSRQLYGQMATLEGVFQHPESLSQASLPEQAPDYSTESQEIVEPDMMSDDWSHCRDIFDPDRYLEILNH